MIVKGKTSTGFEYEVDSRAMADFRFVRLASKLVSLDPASSDATVASVQASEILLGKKNMDRLMEHLEKLHDGYVPFEAAFSEIMEIRNEITETSKEAKN